MNTLRVVCLTLLLALALPLFAQPAASLPVDHWLTSILSRWNEAGYVSHLTLARKPYLRWDVANALYDLSEHREVLSDGDRALLEIALREFDAELKDLAHEREQGGNPLTNLLKKAKQWLGTSSTESTGKIRFELEPTVLASRTPNYTLLEDRIAIGGTYAPIKSVALGIGVRSIERDHYSRNERVRTSTRSSALPTYLRFVSGDFSASMGYELRDWSLANTHSLMLSQTAPALFGYEVSAGFGRLQIDWLYGQAGSYREPLGTFFDTTGGGNRRVTVTSSYERSVLLRRIQYHENRWGVAASIGTMFVYPTRLPTLALLPLPTAITVSQHDDAVRYNEMVSAGFWCRPIGHTMLAGELVFDHLLESKGADRFRKQPTTLAYQLAMSLYDPKWLPVSEVKFAHRFVGARMYITPDDTTSGEGMRWMVDGQGLGDAAGNNFRCTSVQLDKWWSWRVRTGLGVEWKTAGVNYLQQPFLSDYSQRATWDVYGTTVSTISIQPTIEWMQNQNFRIGFASQLSDQATSKNPWQVDFATLQVSYRFSTLLSSD